MVDSTLEVDNIENSGAWIHNGTHVPVLRREPSFSRWCDAEGVIHLNSDSADASVEEDSEFELPFLQSSMQENKSSVGDRQHLGQLNQRNMQLNDGHTMGHMSNYVDGSGNQTKYVPFDVESGSSEERHILDKNVIRSDLIGEDETGSNNDSTISLSTLLKTLFFILVWYTFSTLLTLYNKTLLGDKLGKFPAPLLMNTVHFVMQAVISNTITWVWSHRFKPSVTMSWRDYFLRVVPTALGTALDINLSNASLVFISVTFATMCKSAAPIFLLVFAFAFKLETPSFKLLGIIFIISIGILFTVSKETEFELWGFIFVMLSAVMSGFRWCMTQILLQKEVYGLKDPITLMSYVTPVMAIATALLSLVMDPWHEFRNNAYFDNSWHVFRSFLLMFMGGTLAFFMVLTEYILVSVTSAVTVTIAGVVKEAVTIMVAVFYFHDQFTWLKGVGLLTIMFGVCLFNWYKLFVRNNINICEEDLHASWWEDLHKNSVPNLALHYSLGKCVKHN